MMKQKLYIISILALFSVVVVTGLYFGSKNFIQHPNHFNRKILSSPIELWKTVDIGDNSYYIAGVTSNSIYLGNEITPLSLLIGNIQLSKILKVTIKNLNADSIRSGRL